MAKKPIPVLLDTKNKNKMIIKGSDLKVRDLIHYQHILQNSGTVVHKSEKTYSRKRKHKKEDVFFYA